MKLPAIFASIDSLAINQNKGGEIRYILPSQGKAFASFKIDDATMDEIKAKTAAVGDKYLPRLHVDVKNEAGEVVAKVTHIAYLKRIRLSE